MQVFDALNGLWFNDRNKDQAKSFMHELGHNLGLKHTEEQDGSDPDPDVEPSGSESVKDSVMYYAPLSANKVDYLQDEWDTSDGDGINLVDGLS